MSQAVHTLPALLVFYPLSAFIWNASRVCVKSKFWSKCTEVKEGLVVVLAGLCLRGPSGYYLWLVLLEICSLWRTAIAQAHLHARDLDAHVKREQAVASCWHSVTSAPMWVRLTGQQRSHEAAFVVSPLQWGHSCFPSAQLSCQQLFHGFLPDCLPYIKQCEVRSCSNQFSCMLLHVTAIHIMCLVGFAIEEKQWVVRANQFLKQFLEGRCGHRRK